jgi:hypothetical protein
MEGRIMNNAKLLAIALALLILTGCVSNVVKSEVDREFQSRYDYGERIGVWFVDRFNDLFDVVQVDLSIGAGLGYGALLNAHVTDFGQVGAGWFEGTKVGLKERAFGVWEEKRTEYGLGPFYHYEVARTPVFGTTRAFDHAYDYTGWSIMEDPAWKEDETHWSDVGAAAHFLVLGAEVNVGVFEAFDFVFGFEPISFILRFFDYHHPYTDFQGDDTWNQVRAELEEEKGLGEE